MAIDLSIIRRRERNAMDHLGQTVTIGGTAYRCFPVSMRDTELRNRDQTFRQSYTESIAVVNADVTVAIGAEVTRNGTVRRVLEIQDSADGLQRVLHLGKRYGG